MSAALKPLRVNTLLNSLPSVNCLTRSTYLGRATSSSNRRFYRGRPAICWDVRFRPSVFPKSGQFILRIFCCCVFLTGCWCVSVEPAHATVTTEDRKEVTLTCNIKTTAEDNPQITWFKGNPGIGPIVLKVNTAGKVYISPNYTGRVRLEGQANLVIISPEMSDTGNYSCEALITVDLPPIDAGYVFLNVTLSTTRECTSDFLSFGLAIADTIVLCAGLLLIICKRKETFGDCRMCVVLTYTISLTLCPIAALLLYIHFSLSKEGVCKGKGYIKIIGIVLSSVAILLGCVCLGIRGLIWREHNAKQEKTICVEETANNEGLGMLESNVIREVCVMLDKYGSIVLVGTAENRYCIMRQIQSFLEKEEHTVEICVDGETLYELIVGGKDDMYVIFEEIFRTAETSKSVMTQWEYLADIASARFSRGTVKFLFTSDPTYWSRYKAFAKKFIIFDHVLNWPPEIEKDSLTGSVSSGYIEYSS